ncbi:MAG: hypothetical protein ACRDQ4_04450 [Pseudonocardiaceae bacterium]
MLVAEVLVAEVLVAEVLVAEVLVAEVLVAEVLVTEVLVTETLLEANVGNVERGLAPPPSCHHARRAGDVGNGAQRHRVAAE